MGKVKIRHVYIDVGKFNNVSEAEFIKRVKPHYRHLHKSDLLMKEDYQELKKYFTPIKEKRKKIEKKGEDSE